MGCPDPNLIAEMAAGVLRPEERSSVESHLASCSDCRRTVEVLRQPSEIASGTAIGRYLVLHQVGAGAMGAVYAAHDPKLDRKVALKLLHTSGDQQRLVAEGRAMARLAHPNVVPVLDLGTTDDGRVFAAMEFVDGVTLRRWLERERPSWPKLLSVLIEAGRGLAAAHAVGLTHRDFKPENLLIGRDGRTRVTDFGLARSGTLGGATAAAAIIPDGLATASTTPVSITGTGEIVGTPAYMSPEQFRAQVASARSDQFSFCVVVWEALYGGRPFDDGTAGVQTLADAVLQGRVREPVAGRRLPAAFKRILLRGLSTDPDLRFPSLDELLRALAEVGQRRRRVGRAATLIAVGGLLTAGAVMMRRDAQLCRDAGALPEWSPTRRAALAAAFKQSGASFAEPSWPFVERALDEWARAFTAMGKQACEATEIQRTQSREVLLLRNHCMEERKAGLSALLAALDQPTPAIVERAAQGAASLGRIADCADLKRLVGPTPPRPEVAGEAEALRKKLAAVRMQSVLGLGSAARQQLTPIAERAHAIGDRALEGEALVIRSQLEHKGGAIDASLASARAAVIAAEEGRDEPTRTRAWLRQVELLAERAPEDAARALENARAVLSRVEDAEVEAIYESHAANLDYWAGRAQAAHQHDLNAIRLAEKHFGPDAAQVASFIGQSATTLTVLGDYDGADAQLGRAMTLIEKGRGRDHPSYAINEATLAFVQMARGRQDLAVGLAEDSLARLERSRGPQHLELLQPLDALARALRDLGRIREARKVAERALQIGELTGRDSPEAAGALVTLSAVLRAQRAWDEAEPPLVRLVKVVKGHPYVSEAQMGLAEIALHRGKVAGARALCEQARGGLDASQEADVMNNEMCLAQVDEAEGAFLRALERNLKVVAFSEKRHRSPMPWGYGGELVDVARLQLRLGRREQALPLLERALAAEPSPAVGVVGAMVEARLLLAKNDPARKKTLVAEAAALVAKQEFPDPAHVAEARRLQAGLTRLK